MIIINSENIKYWVGVRRGIVYLMGRKNSSDLGYSLSRDCVSMKMPVVVQPKIYLSLKWVKMSNHIFENNGVNGTGTLYEYPSPGRCFPAHQREPGRHPETATVKWNKEVNEVMMEYFYRSKLFDEEGKPIMGYRKRMFREWKAR